MEWENYYRRVAINFNHQIEHYKKALKELEQQKSDLLNSAEPKTFMLAGFHPNNGTPQSFLCFCAQIHNNSADRILFVDMNKEPLTRLPKRSNITAIQSRLEDLPVSIKPLLDFAFLDFTTLFMNDEQIKASALSISKILNTHGLLLSVSVNPQWLSLTDDLLDGGRERPTSFLPQYERSLSETICLFSYPYNKESWLKPVYVNCNLREYLVVFSTSLSEFKWI